VSDQERAIMLDRLFQGLLLATAVTIPLAIFNGTLFSWHPTLMSVGFLGLMGNGVLTAFKFRNVLESNARVKAIQKHALWQIAAVACIGGGFMAIYQNKVGLQFPHLFKYF
jgi:cytochrome b-561 domain containing protein 2